MEYTYMADAFFTILHTSLALMFICYIQTPRCKANHTTGYCRESEIISRCISLSIHHIKKYCKIKLWILTRCTIYVTWRFLLWETTKFVLSYAQVKLMLYWTS